MLQQEHIKKRIAERKRISSQNRSVSSITMGNQLGGLLNNFGSSGVKKVAIDLGGEPNSNQGSSTSVNPIANFSSDPTGGVNLPNAADNDPSG